MPIEHTLFSLCAFQIFENVAQENSSISQTAYANIPIDIQKRLFSVLLQLPKDFSGRYATGYTFRFLYANNPNFLDDRPFVKTHRRERVDYSSLERVKLIEEKRISALMRQITNCSQLKVLSLPFHNLTTGEAKALTKACPNLEKLTLRSALAKDLVRMRSKLNYLKTVTLEPFILGNAKFTDNHVRAILENGHCLSKLSLEIGRDVTDSSFSEINKHKNTLTSFTVKHASCLSPQWFKEIVSNLYQLQILRVSYLAKAQINKDIVSSCSFFHYGLLTHLNLYGCEGLDDQYLASLIKRNPNLTLCQLIDCHAANASLIAAFDCHNLITLKLEDTHFSFEHLDTTRIVSTGLKELSISGAVAYENTLLHCLGALTELQTLKLVFESQADSMDTLFVLTPHVEHLTLSYDSFNELEELKVENRYQVKTLTIEGHSFNSTDIFEDILAEFPQIREIHCNFLQSMMYDPEFLESYRSLKLNYPYVRMMTNFQARRISL